MARRETDGAGRVHPAYAHNSRSRWILQSHLRFGERRTNGCQPHKKTTSCLGQLGSSGLSSVHHLSPENRSMITFTGHRHTCRFGALPRTVSRGMNAVLPWPVGDRQVRRSSDTSSNAALLHYEAAHLYVHPAVATPSNRDSLNAWDSYHINFFDPAPMRNHSKIRSNFDITLNEECRGFASSRGFPMPDLSP